MVAHMIVSLEEHDWPLKDRRHEMIHMADVANQWFGGTSFEMMFLFGAIRLVDKTKLMAIWCKWLWREGLDDLDYCDDLVIIQDR